MATVLARAARLKAAKAAADGAVAALLAGADLEALQAIVGGAVSVRYLAERELLARGRTAAGALLPEARRNG